MMTLLCSACPATAPLEDGNVNIDIVQEHDINYEEMAVAAVETALKDRLKNPESLQIHNVGLADDSYEDDSVYFCTVAVDYSAQNGFGGYNRDTVKSHIEINKSTGTVTELDEAAYFNRRAGAQFGEGLRSIGVGIPFQLITLEDSYARLLTDIAGNDVKTSTFTYENGEKEVNYISTLADLEGVATFYFYSESEKIYQIEFFWSDGQLFYDGTKAYTLGTEYTATLDDVEALKGRIDDTLNISHGQIKESTETYFHDYECNWYLTDGIYIKLSWSVHDGDNAIGHIQLLLTNEINGAEG